LLNAINKYLGIECTLNEWRYLFQQNFNALQPFLVRTSRVAPLWCCPERGFKFPVIPEGEGVTAVSPNYAILPSMEVRNIPPEALEMWVFCPVELSTTLCSTFSLHPAPAVLSAGTYRLGFLRNRAGRVPAYFLKCPAKNYLPLARLSRADSRDPGLYFTPYYCPDTEEWLVAKACGYFPLEDYLDLPSLKRSPHFRPAIQSFIAQLPGPTYQPNPDVKILADFKRIRFPDGSCVNLSKAHKRRAVVRFIFEWCRESGKAEFDVEVVREDYNERHPERPWKSDRFKDDLFKGATADFDLIFETVDAALGKYRLKL
jgi:hypothetical protein